MIFPVLPAQQLGLVVAVLVGFAFGFVLERAGFGRAQKLAAQFYGTDMTVFKVMFGAIVTAMLGAVVAAGLGLADFRTVADHVTSSTLLGPMVVGGLMLGAGFIVSGYCPGTSFVAAASGKVDGLVTVLGVMAGQLLWAGLEWREPFKAFHVWGDRGNFYLWELLHLPSREGPVIVALAVTAAAVGCFLAVERLERALAARADAAARPTPAGRPGRLVFAGLAAAAVLGLVTLALPTGTQARLREPAQLSQLDLARRIFSEPWDVRVVDVRELAACAARRIPGSECVPLADLGKLRLADAAPGRDLVLVAAGDLQQAPREAAAYPGRLFLLQGGFRGWEAFALEPPVPPPAGAPAAEVELYRLRAGIQSAMTGMKAAPPPPPPSAVPAAPRKAGGGCSG